MLIRERLIISISISYKLLSKAFRVWKTGEAMVLVKPLNNLVLLSRDRPRCLNVSKAKSSTDTRDFKDSKKRTTQMNPGIVSIVIVFRAFLSQRVELSRNTATSTMTQK